jgi:1,6-anhydro-N-acetylmuramate kinase
MWVDLDKSDSDAEHFAYLALTMQKIVPAELFHRLTIAQHQVLFGIACT